LKCTFNRDEIRNKASEKLNCKHKAPLHPICKKNVHLAANESLDTPIITLCALPDLLEGFPAKPILLCYQPLDI
jgi:hypothetical protein